MEPPAASAEIAQSSRAKERAERRSGRLGGAHQRLEALVVGLAGGGDSVAAAPDHRAFGGERFGQSVGDRLERRRVAAGEDEYREAGGRQALQRDLRLPGGPLALQQLDPV